MYFLINFFMYCIVYYILQILYGFGLIAYKMIALSVFYWNPILYDEVVDIFFGRDGRSHIFGQE